MSAPSVADRDVRAGRHHIERTSRALLLVRARNVEPDAKRDARFPKTSLTNAAAHYSAASLDDSPIAAFTRGITSVAMSSIERRARVSSTQSMPA